MTNIFLVKKNNFFTQTVSKNSVKMVGMFVKVKNQELISLKI